MPPMRGRTSRRPGGSAGARSGAAGSGGAGAAQNDPRSLAGPRVDESEIVPTRLNLTVVYIPGASLQRGLCILRPGQDLRSSA